MALILAVNPGGSHNAMLARLARELRGHELVGADSCFVAIASLAKQAPDLVLLPPQEEPGLAELLKRLQSLHTRVHTLTLPAAAKSDPRAFARVIRETLSGHADGRQRESKGTLRHQPSPAPHRPGPAPHPPTPPPHHGPTQHLPSTSPHLLAAGAALADWIHARRATWSETPAKDVAIGLRPAALPRRGQEPLRPYEAPQGHERSWTDESARDDESPQEEWVPERVEFPSLAERIGEALGAWRQKPVRSWLPRAAALLVAAAVAAGAYAYWPNMRTALTTGEAVFESVPPGSEVFIDGAFSGTTPLTMELPTGQHNVEFRRGNLTRTTTVSIASLRRRVERLDWSVKPTGNLRVASDPSGARVIVDGKLAGTTPLVLEGLTADSHSVVLETSAGSIRRNVMIAAGLTTSLNEVLVAGWLAVVAPFEVQVFEGNKPLRLDEGGRVMMPPGPHKLRFTNRFLRYDEERAVEIKPTEITTVNLLPTTSKP